MSEIIKHMKIKAVTFNLRMENRSDGINYFFNRAPFIIEKIKAQSPDIICFQEATVKIYNWLKANFPDYEFVGNGRSEEFLDEANPIAFKKSIFELFGLCQFWLSPTPEIPGSRYEHQSICPRICTQAVLRIKSEARLLRVYNTHLDHIDEEARLLGMNSILAKIAADNAANRLPLILTGDMNALPDEISMRAVRDFKECPLKDITESIECSFHDWGRVSDKIDYIYTDAETDFEGVSVWDDCNDGIYLTDHYPISATIDI